MRQMRQKPHRFVVLFGRKRRYPFKTERAAEIFHRLHVFVGILFRGRHDVICPDEDYRIGVFDAADFFACHRMRPHEFQVATKNFLHVFDDERLHTGNVGDKRARLY